MAKKNTPNRPRPAGKFILAGFSRPLPLEARFGFELLLAELAQIPPVYAAELKKLETNLSWLAYNVAETGVTNQTAADCQGLLAAIRHQIKACEGKIRLAALKADEEYRAGQHERQRRHERWQAARVQEDRGPGTLVDLETINAEAVSVERVEKPRRLSGKPARRVKKAAKKASLRKRRVYER